uniref:Uncharacterized protein n=1 Tax=Helianthus annuus TaxID=4232 RepID=A0A251S6T9_HELAN
MQISVERKKESRSGPRLGACFKEERKKIDKHMQVIWSLTHNSKGMSLNLKKRIYIGYLVNHQPNHNLSLQDLLNSKNNNIVQGNS